LLPENVVFAKNPYDAADGSDALLILTDWKEFAELDLRRVRRLLKYPIVIDGRNLYDPSRMVEADLVYYSMGRPPRAPEHIASAIQLQEPTIVGPVSVLPGQQQTAVA